MRIDPINARLVRAELAPQVVVPAFDSLTEADKDEVRRANELTFLHAMHAPHDSPDGALTRSSDGLARLISAGAFGPELGDVGFVYRMTHPRGAQTGLVCSIPAESFADGGEVLPHEDVQPDLVAYLAAYLARLGVSSSPVKATFRSTPTIDELMKAATGPAPDLRFGDASDLLQEIWIVHDLRPFVAAFDAVQRAYITDGHHRSAAAQMLGPTVPVLTVLFPDEHLTITQFNRLVRGVPRDSLRSWLADRSAQPLEAPPAELQPGTAGVYVDERWHEVGLPVVAADPPDSLDPSVLETAVLRPLLGIDDPTTDDRLQYVPGSVDLEELATRAGSDGVAFALAPVAVTDVMRVADLGLAMPAKSTYFEPKARSGVFLMRH